MGTIKEKLSEDIKVAMRARDSRLLLVLRSVMAVIKQVEVDTRTELADERVKELFQKEIKKRRDTQNFARDAGREEIVAANEYEIELIQKYLGAQLSEDALKDIIRRMVNEGGADSLGKIMGALSKDYKGQYEGSVASAFAKELLAGS